MERILYKEADGDITCRSRDFDKVFPTLYAYEETGLTPEQVAAMKGLHTARLDLLAENEKLKAELVKIKVARKNERYELLSLIRVYGGCNFCKHKDLHADMEPCCNCRGTGSKTDKWEWRGAKDTNVPGKKEE